MLPTAIIPRSEALASTPLTSPDLHDQAYAAMDEGRLRDAASLFAQLIDEKPGRPHYHYMQGLVHKYLRDWKTSLEHNLLAQTLEDGVEEASCWNAGIAATGLGDWAEARRQWARTGIRIAEGEGRIEGENFGRTCLRLNPWGAGETLWATRLDPVRARIDNVPYPESGYRFGDIVLHDGASTGSRESRGRTYPVFNVMQRLERSDFQTFVAFVRCDRVEDIEALEDLRRPGLGLVEDWTKSIRNLCLRCSYGVAHDHLNAANGDWSRDRNVGIAAQSRATVERLLKDWAAAGDGRRVDDIGTRDHPPSSPDDGVVWWRDPTETS